MPNIPAKINPRKLRRLYKSGKTVRQIAKKLRYCKQTIYRYLELYDIYKRIFKWERVHIPKDELMMLYVKEKKSTEYISRIYKCSRGTVENKLRKYKIDSKEPGSWVVKKIHISRDRLEELYVKERMTAKSIGKIFKCNKGVILRRLKEYGIKRRIIDNSKHYNILTKSYLKEHYIDRNKTMKEIADELGCKEGVVFRVIHQQGILRKTMHNYEDAHGITKQDLIELYHKGNNSAMKVAELLNCCESTIFNKLRKFNIPIKEGYLAYYTVGINEEALAARQHPKYLDWVNKVYKKYNYRCIICFSNRDLRAHHLKSFTRFPEYRFDEDNGVCLCNQHHDSFIVESFHHTYGTLTFTEEQFYEYYELNREKGLLEKVHKSLVFLRS